MILILIIIVLLIGVAVYFLTKPKDDVSNIQKLLDDIPSVFGVKLTEQFKVEKYEAEPLFKVQNDIVKNMNVFIKYAYPKLNMDEINKILKDNGLNKTLTEIFNDKKNLTKYASIFISSIITN